MKGKTLLCLVIVLSMTLILMPAIAKAPPASLELIFVDTGTNQMSAGPGGTVNKTIGDSFDVELKVFDIPSPGLWSWAVRITWDPTVISATGATEGTFLSSVGPTLFPPPRIVEGEIEEMASVLMVEAGATGNGTLATITFEIVGFGDTNITIYESHLLETGAGHPEIPHDVVDAHFTMLAPPPTSPTAVFTPETSTQFTLDAEGRVTVEFDASASGGGFDTEGIEGPTPIVNYTWDFGDGTPTVETNETIIEHVYEPADPNVLTDVPVTLTVYAPDPNPPTHVDYEEYVSTTHIIHLIHLMPRPVGADIDVYTEYGYNVMGGKGKGANKTTGSEEGFEALGWSDAFGPQEEITVFALITYNEEPVPYKLVAFQVKDKDGVTHVYRTAFTNESGVATVSFRIPWAGMEAEDLFGVWRIIGTVDIVGEVVIDIVKFYFGYLVEISGVFVDPDSLKKTNSITVTVEITNFAFTTKNVYVAIVIYDELGVPIDNKVFPASAAAGSHDGTLLPKATNVSNTLTIPTWAFVGVATVYTNIFDEPPGPPDFGTPMTSEAFTTFVILKTADP